MDQLKKDITNVINSSSDASILYKYLTMDAIPNNVKLFLYNLFEKRLFKYMHKAKFHTRTKDVIERELYCSNLYPNEILVKVSPTEFVRINDYLTSINLITC